MCLGQNRLVILRGCFTQWQCMVRIGELRGAVDMVLAEARSVEKDLRTFSRAGQEGEFADLLRGLASPSRGGAAPPRPSRDVAGSRASPRVWARLCLLTWRLQSMQR